MTPNVFMLAELTTGAILVGTAAASWAAAYLLRPKRDKNLRVESARTTLTTRGSKLPLLVGRRRVAPLFGCAGNRRVRQERARSGKGLLKPKAPASDVYYEDGWHQLCVGPASAIHRIYERGDVVWEGPIDRYATPSGTTVETAIGSFVVYWGEVDQPVSSEVGDLMLERIGQRVDSRWPYVCHLVWLGKRLGSSPTWPQLEYELEVDCVGSALVDSACYLGDTTGGVEPNDGPNYAHVLYQLFTAEHPHGVGIEPELVDFAALEAAGVLCEDEHTPAHVEARDGESLASVLARVAQEHGLFVAQRGRVLSVIPIRSVDDPPVFTGESLRAPNPEFEVEQGAPELDRAVYVYDSRANAYTPMPVSMSDDAEARENARRTVDEQPLTTVTDRVTAVTVATRRQMEWESPRTQVIADLLHTARELYPGDVFELDGFGVLRVGSVLKRVGARGARVEATRDAYSDALTEWDRDPGVPPGSSGSLALDLAQAAFELPRRASEVVAIGIARVRGTVRSSASSVFLGTDESALIESGRQDVPAAGFTLDEVILARTLPIHEGTVGVALGPDAPTSVDDLSQDHSAWLSGQQVLLVNDELMLMKSVTALGSGRFTLDGLVRGWADTPIRHHAVGSTAYVIRATSVEPQSSPWMSPSVVARVKSVPDGIAPDAVEAMTVTLDGRAVSPPAVTTLGVVDSVERHTLDVASITVSSRSIVASGIHFTKMRGVRRVTLSGTAANDGTYQVESVSVSGDDTLIVVKDTLPGADAGAVGTIRPTSVGPTYGPGEDAVVVWDHQVDSRQADGLVPSSLPYGSAYGIGQPARDGLFKLEVLGPSSAVLRTVSVDSDRPSFVYTSSMRTDDHGVADPDSFTVRVTAVRGSIGAHPRTLEVFKR